MLTLSRDFADMEPWLPAGASQSATDISGSGGLVLTLREQIRLSRTIETMLTKLFSPTTKLTLTSRRSCVEALNLNLHRWQASLPANVQWNRWEAASAPLNPSVAALQ